MREIKFRAWYKNKFYFFSIGKLWTPDNIDMHDTLCIDGISFEQFTGLRDKNGKEIYEGDIIEINFLDDDKSIFLVEWIVDQLDSGWNITPCDLDDSTVIGNIHENNELLQGEHK